MRPLIPLFILLIFASCKNIKTYENKSGNCKLELFSDSTFSFKYPTFFGSQYEKGTYKIKNNSIILGLVTDNIKDSIVDFSSSYLEDDPDSVKFTFRNLNNSNIIVSFTINQNKVIFQTDKAGCINLMYRDLIEKKIVSIDSSIYGLSISFNNIIYSVVDSLIKPTNIDIKLNQFVGSEKIFIHRNFDYSQDTIKVSGFDPKTFNDWKLIRR
jgi:hypothetical protein